MTENAGETRTVHRRHRARRLSIWNGAIWALGNGLASTTLIIYLAKELHAERLGLGIGLILAAPHFVGFLRIAAPVAMQRLANRKGFCLAMFLLSAVFLLAVPGLCVPGRLPSPGCSLAALVVLWCLYHLFQYLGMVALWSWLADMAHPRIRGRFFGRRERWMVAATVVAAVDAGLFVWGFLEIWPGVGGWVPYVITAMVGAALMLVALLPLALAPDCVAAGDAARRAGSSRRPIVLQELLRPLRDGNFLRFTLFGCWFSFFNGITQSAQDYYPMQVLGVSLLLSQTLRTGMRLGQCGLSPWLGAMADRFGNRAVMIVCQCIVAAGLLFFAVATPANWHWFIGAWVHWIAYAGLNICLPNMVLKLAPPTAAASYIAAFDGVRGFFYAVSTVIGGLLVDRYKLGGFFFLATGTSFFVGLFLFGAAMRGLGALLLLPVDEAVDDRN